MKLTSWQIVQLTSWFVSVGKLLKLASCPVSKLPSQQVALGNLFLLLPWQVVWLLNYQVDKLTYISWQVVQLASCQVAKLSSWQVGKLPSCQVVQGQTKYQGQTKFQLATCQLGKLSNWQVAKLASCPVGKLASCPVGKLPCITWQVVQYQLVSC